MTATALEKTKPERSHTVSSETNTFQGPFKLAGAVFAAISNRPCKLPELPLILGHLIWIKKCHAG